MVLRFPQTTPSKVIYILCSPLKICVKSLVQLQLTLYLSNAWWLFKYSSNFDCRRITAYFISFSLSSLGRSPSIATVMLLISSICMLARLILLTCPLIFISSKSIVLFVSDRQSSLSCNSALLLFPFLFLLQSFYLVAILCSDIATKIVIWRHIKMNIYSPLRCLLMSLALRQSFTETFMCSVRSTISSP